jgi:hypothetical protein
MCGRSRFTDVVEKRGIMPGCRQGYSRPAQFLDYRFVRKMVFE